MTEVGGLPVTLDVPSAGRLLGIGRSRAYQLPATGGFPCPVLRIGGSWRVPTAPLLELLDLPIPERQDRDVALQGIGVNVENATADGGVVTW